MKHTFALFLATALLHCATACKRQPAAGPADPASPETPASTAASASTLPTATAPSPAPAPTAATMLPQAKPGASESSPLNGELTNAVARFLDKHKRLPASWQELVQTGFLKALPQAPPGVRYAIDPISAMVVEIK
ncbi:MAG: hypothetical protein B9S33_06930 [Pedosphaera sp. Tous-C6FEB]|nr:MAG: hypothetical protein B9S33_06930 [Pedosphaera sp. Tous-C6FEB]